MKKWKCTVCGYIHNGNEPPRVCPVCGADRSKFVLMEDEQDDHLTESKPSTGDEPEEDKIKEEMPFYQKYKIRGHSLSEAAKIASPLTRLHGHPIAVHIPNGVLPFCFLFTLVAIIFNSGTLLPQRRLIRYLSSLPCHLFWLPAP